MIAVVNQVQNSELPLDRKYAAMQSHRTPREIWCKEVGCRESGANAATSPAYVKGV
jgi:hypothetical protein